jgi:ABC-type transport system substrate-binding protein
MDNKVPPFNNPQVRQAVNLALDRSTFNASQQGLCKPIGQFFPQGMDGYVSSLTPQYDPAKAKQLVQAAGATGAKVKLLTITFGAYPAFAQLIQAQLDAIGLNVEIVTQPGNVFRVTYNQGGAGMLLGQEALFAPDPSQLLDQFVLSSFNPGTKDPALVAEIQHAEQLPVGSKERTAAMQTINKDLLTALVWSPICQPVNILAATKNVIGLNKIEDLLFTSLGVFGAMQAAK